MRPRLLDLFCGAGGVAKGYHDAGFDVVGVDNRPQPRYPYDFHLGDALDVLRRLLDPLQGIQGQPNGVGMASGYYLDDFAAIHASPPCQGYSRMRHLPWLKGRTYPMLIDETIALLEQTGKTWVVENVEDAWKHMKGAIFLCGTMFSLKVYRHRLFLSNAWLWQPPHPAHKHVIGAERMLNNRAGPSDDGWISLPSKCGMRRWEKGQMASIAGNSVGAVGGIEAAKAAMGIDWMRRHELAQAIPPAYTEYVGKQLMNALAARVASPPG